MSPKDYSVEIISTGYEILYGRITDTNSSWLARRITELGGSLKRVTSVGDNEGDIATVIREALSRETDLIIITGGLGPSGDDITVNSIGVALGRDVVLDDETLKKINRIYGEQDAESRARRSLMARTLEGSRALNNPLGVAVGTMVEEGVTKIFTFPGVPKEMKEMFNLYVAPIIEEKSKVKNLAKTLTVRMVFKDFFPMYRKMLRDHPDVFIKNAATAPEGLDERSRIKDIKVDVVTTGTTREESIDKMDNIIRDFRSRIEELNGELFE